jgi:hypothetical protein
MQLYNQPTLALPVGKHTPLLPRCCSQRLEKDVHKQQLPEAPTELYILDEAPTELYPLIEPPFDLYHLRDRLTEEGLGEISG